MTQILSLITPDFVIQVSDRRLTDLKKGEPMTWKANKTVVVPSVQMMFSYTGLAALTPTTTTDEWLMRRSFELRDSENYFEAIGNAATEIFKTIALPSGQKRHAFVGVGWLPQDFETIPPQPVGFKPGAFCVLISNFLDDQRRELAEAREEFNTESGHYSRAKSSHSSSREPPSQHRNLRGWTETSEVRSGHREAPNVPRVSYCCGRSR
jgi:hypothetical protein